MSEIVDQFIQEYVKSAPLMRWKGISLWQNPCDCWVYGEILWETKPDLIIETGTASGGTALFLADLCESFGKGHVVTIDVSLRRDFPDHPRLVGIPGNSIHPEALERIRLMIQDSDRVMVLLDSDHSTEHVLKELTLYAPFVSPGCYLIVEDTHLLLIQGPGEAVQSWLPDHPEFEIDHGREKFLLTAHPGGFLRRKES